MNDTEHLPLANRLEAAPLGRGNDDDQALVEELRAKCTGDDGAVFDNPAVRALIAGISAGSPYLTGLLRRDPARSCRLFAAPPEVRLDTLIVELGVAVRSVTSRKELLAALRAFKNEAALLIALADLGGVWPIMAATRALTRVADAAVSETVGYLFREAQAKGQWLDGDSGDPERTSGYFVLAMGKQGAFELNFSSDIDLIVFYDRDKARLADRSEAQTFYVKLTQELVKCLSEQTGDGYVFRGDLRLRPDPGATQAAMSTDAALQYYESFGQNWERAAMIKARPIAGDIAAGEAFLKDLAPFVWRKYLDYAAIADVHAMKRQIHVHRGFGEIAVAGHNIKVGRGGIREIEFFAQTQQLIAGGRQPDLRSRATLTTLDILVRRGWIEAATRDDLAEAYRYLRWLEHRIQMVADQQTHELPSDPERLEAFARFAGYGDVETLTQVVRQQLETVQQHYSVLFEDVPQLSATSANLVFTGEDDDPGTIEALTAMGYARPAHVIATVRAWHRGRYPAVRSEKVRERLTDVQPVLIEALADTVDPDAALVGFDRFLGQLPAGIQLFALLKANPDLMRLLANIVGSAPRLASILSKRRRVFDAVLDPRTMAATPDPNEVADVIASEFAAAGSFEEILDRARVIGGEQMFLVGVRILTGDISAENAGGAFAVLAEELIRQLHDAVLADFKERHGAIAGGEVGVLAMGKLGGREMTASSDLDLITVYDFDPAATSSDGARPLAPSQYYARLTQRLISALSAPTAEGLLYEVDMRLRPSGQKGPVATQLSSFVEYQKTQAWTWEHMALTRARVIAGPEELRARIADAVHASLVIPRDRTKIAEDVRDMRARIAKEKGTDNIWDLKQARGGFVDIEFACQFLQLVHAAERPDILDQRTEQAIAKIRDAGFLSAGSASVLLDTLGLIQALGQVTRLCFEGPFDPDKAPDGLKDLLAKIGSEPTFGHLEARLRQALADSAAVFDEIVV